VCVFTAYLLQSFAGKSQLLSWSLLCLLDEGVQDNNLVSDNGTEKGSPYSFSPFGAYLEESFPQCASKRHAEIRTEHLHPFGDPSIDGTNTNWPRLNILPHGFTIIADLPDRKDN
jgi:hypothetical protein